MSDNVSSIGEEDDEFEYSSSRGRRYSRRPHGSRGNRTGSISRSHSRTSIDEVELSTGIVSANDVFRDSFASSRYSGRFNDFDGPGDYQSTRASSIGSNYSAFDSTRPSTFLPAEHELPGEVDFDDQEFLHSDSDSEIEDDESDDESVLEENMYLSIRGVPRDQERSRQRFRQQAKLITKASPPPVSFRKSINQTPTTPVVRKNSSKTLAKVALPKKKRKEGGYNIAGKATLQKWNRWIHDKYQNSKNHVSLGKMFDQSSLNTISTDSCATMTTDDTVAPISLEEVISNPKMIRYYAAWLNEIEDQAKVFFLCSLDEFRNLWRQMNHQRFSEDDDDDSEEENRQVIHTYATKMVEKYMVDDTQYFLGTGFVNKSDTSKILKETSRGGESALHAFDDVAFRTKQSLMCDFPEFRKTDLHDELHSSVPREVYRLEDLLLNQRFSNFYWVFLFQHSFHREMALWLEIEYNLKGIYREYVQASEGNTSSQRKNAANLKARVSKTIKYLLLKYYPGDDSIQDLHLNIPVAMKWLKEEREIIVEKLNESHLELYPRFIASRAYAEFASYRQAAVSRGETASELLDESQDLRRLSFILRNYGLRMHLKYDDGQEKSVTTNNDYSIEGFRETNGQNNDSNPISFIVSFETRSGSGQSLRLNIKQHALPHESKPTPLPSGIEGFLIPWCVDQNKTYLTSTTNPKIHAFNTFMTDGPTELYVSCLIVYTKGPPFSPEELEQELISGSRWIPSGICLFSKYPLLNVLRSRIAEHFGRNVATPWKLTSKEIEKICQPYTPPRSISVTSMKFPLTDHSLDLLFGTLDISTVIHVFTAILLECRVLFMSDYYSVLARVAESFRVLMNPLKWPHVFLPVLPGLMIQCMQCPTPFIIGCNKEILNPEILEEVGSEVLVVDLDKSQIIQGDIPTTLPVRLLNSLFESVHSATKISVTKSDSVFFDSFPKLEVFPDIQVRTAFYETIMEAIGNFGYHRYVWKDELSQKEVYLFDEASYLAGSNNAVRPFRTAFVATQAFSEFISGHNGFVDEDE